MNARAVAISWIASLSLVSSVLVAAMPEDLDAIQSHGSVELTTIGQRSGTRRTVTVWFVREGDRIYVQAGKDGQRYWYQNLLANPEVRLGFGSFAVKGRAEAIEDPAEAERVLALFRRKYLTARIASWLGSRFGQGKVVRVQSLERVPAGAAP